MNVRTLQCMETQTKNNKGVRMKPCQISDLQKVNCSINSDHSMKISWRVKGWFFTFTYYLYLNDHNYIASSSWTRNPQQWNSDNNQPCGAKMTYEGKVCIS